MAETKAELIAEPKVEVVQQLRQLLGEKGVREQPDAVMPQIILLPRNTDEVSGILKVCSAAGQPEIGRASCRERV